MVEPYALDQLVAGIMGQKAAKAARLTPVGTETAKQSLPRTPADFPNDMPQEVVEQAIDAIEWQAQRLMDAAAALRLVIGKEKIVNTAPTQKEIEREADAKHAQAEVPDYAELQRQAQAAVFKSLDEPEPEGWTCPKHGAEKLSNEVSGRGRKYRQCRVGTCKEFER